MHVLLAEVLTRQLVSWNHLVGDCKGGAHAPVRFTDSAIYAERLPESRIRRAAVRGADLVERAGSQGGGFRDGGFWRSPPTTSKRYRAQRRVPQLRKRGDPGRFKNDIAREDIEVQRLVMLNMDAPHHTRLRNISRGFHATRSDAAMSPGARAWKDRRGGGRCGFWRLCSSRFPRAPLQAIAAYGRAAGVTAAAGFHWLPNEMTGNEDPEYAHRSEGVLGADEAAHENELRLAVL